MDIFKTIEIRRENTFVAFLIEEALEEKAPFTENARYILHIKPTINNSYGVITKGNEITRYSVTLDVSYILNDRQTKNIVFKK